MLKKSFIWFRSNGGSYFLPTCKYVYTYQTLFIQLLDKIKNRHRLFTIYITFIYTIVCQNWFSYFFVDLNDRNCHLTTVCGDVLSGRVSGGVKT